MSGHSPRSVEHDPSKCAAYGCPMLGTMTTSTNGTSEWFCFLHFGKDSVQWQAITAELNRLRWLVEAVQTMRAFYGTAGWGEIYLTALHEIRMHQRKDLEKLEGNKESVPAWFLRLERELAAAVEVAAKPPVSQLRVGQPQAKSDTWSKVSFGGVAQNAETA